MESSVLTNTVLAERSEGFLNEMGAELLHALSRAAVGGAPVQIETIEGQRPHMQHHFYDVEIVADQDVIITISNGHVEMRALRTKFTLTPEIESWLDELAYNFGMNVEAVGDVCQDQNGLLFVISKFEGADPSILDNLPGVHYQPTDNAYRARVPDDMRGYPLHVRYQTETHERSISFKSFERVCLQ